MRLSRLPREARRTRKPKQPNWIKYPNKSCWIQCTYYKCSHCWKYSGGKNWAECPVCHTSSKVAAAKKSFASSKVAAAKKSFASSKVAAAKDYVQENDYEDNFTME